MDSLSTRRGLDLEQKLQEEMSKSVGFFSLLPHYLRFVGGGIGECSCPLPPLLAGGGGKTEFGARTDSTSNCNHMSKLRWRLR